MHLCLIHNASLDADVPLENNQRRYQLKGRYGMKNMYFKKGLSLAGFLILSLMISALTFTAVALVERALTG